MNHWQRLHEEGPFRLMGTTTIYALYDAPVEVQGTIYRLDTARHPKEDFLGATKCLYIKCRHYSGLQGVLKSPAPVKRNWWQRIKFQWWLLTTKVLDGSIKRSNTW